MTWWMTALIIAGVILLICLIGFIYVCVIAKGDGKAADPDYTKVAFAAQEAGKLLIDPADRGRYAVCRVTRGIQGVRIEVSSEGNPPVHFDREIILLNKTEEEYRNITRYAADSAAHFTGGRYIVVQEYNDSYRLEKNVYFTPVTLPRS